MTRTQTIYYTVLGGLAAAGSIVAQALGGWDTMLQTLVAVMAIDYALGIVLALVWKNSNKTPDGSFESRASIKGLFRKCGILLCVLVAARLDALFCVEGYVRSTVIFFFLANEGLSVIENLGVMGLPMPEALKNAFLELRKKGEES